MCTQELQGGSDTSDALYWEGKWYLVDARKMNIFSYGRFSGNGFASIRSSVKITFCLYACNSSRKAEQIFSESDIWELHENASVFGLNLT